MSVEVSLLDHDLGGQQGHVTLSLLPKWFGTGVNGDDLRFALCTTDENHYSDTVYMSLKDLREVAGLLAAAADSMEGECAESIWKEVDG